MFFKKLLFIKPIQILLVILLFVCVSPYLTYEEYSILYTVSVVIKDALIFVLPFTVFAYIASSLIYFKNKASLLVVSIIIFEALSNASSVLYAYGCHKIFASSLIINLRDYDIKQLTSYIKISQYNPSWWRADKGAILGLIIGLYSVYSRRGKALLKYIEISRNIANFIFTKIFSKLLLIVVPGFIANLMYNQTLIHLLQSSKANLIFMILAMIIYIEFLFLGGANFNFRVALRKSCTIIPSIITAFTSMCSIITMPITIAAARKNLKNPDYAELVIPMATNVQMIGDCFVNAFLCILVIKIFGYPVPDFIEWTKFTFIFTLVRYATVGVSGGTTFLLLPLYEKYLHFNHEMLAIMLTFNIVLDPIITAANVAGNGVLVLIFEKFFNFISIKGNIYDKKIT